MKKFLLPVAFFAIALTSCGGGGDIDADVQKICDISKKMKDAATSGNMEEVSKLTKEVQDMGMEMEKKYANDKAAQEKFTEKVKECVGM